MLLVDSHCHLDQLDLSSHDGKIANALEAAKAAGVGYFVCVCIDMQNWPAVFELAQTYPNVWATVGLHPNESCEQEPSEAQLISLASQPKVVALGETGLDYYRTTGDVTWQQERFRRHIRAAIQVKKPLVIHNRDAGLDTIRIIKEENASAVGGVFHCFADTWDVAQAAMDLNFYISFSGIVTFKNAQSLQDIAKKVPLSRMLVETDSPYLAPVPYRGKTNEPAYVRFVAQAIADLKGISYEEVAQTTTQNCQKLFGIRDEHL